ncbi:MAG: EAL domain-containing protein [Actinomycetota bacterium]|jgi:EAL domain-containing protein (putative c-di-GMP-specific phosphodiesterase class I)|nr:EAL domain-containing protein [Actinomycetota bacterium]MDA8075108.1 EAL domain-containing protein [Actinomycetota bacterium]
MGLREIVAETSDPASVMERVVAETVTLVPDADGAAIAVCRDDGPLCFTVAAGNLEGFVGTELPLDGSLSGIAVRSGVVQHSSDTTADPRVDSAASRALGISSMICVPLRRGDERIGVLNVASRRPGAFGPADEANLDKLAGFVSTVVGAAIDLASVTSRLLGADEPVGAADDPSPRGQVAYSGARGVFVANVVRPGAAVGSAARDRIEMVLTGTGHAVVFQPIVSLHTGAVHAVEALSRFAGPPEQTPDRWFAEAAGLGLGGQLELFAVERALALLPELPEPLRMGVNVGPETFCSAELIDLVVTSDPHRVIVELTEHTGIEDYPGLRQARQELRALGAKVAIDDTGTGFASLSVVLQIAPDIIKLDRELTSGIDLDPVRRALAGSLVGFGAETGAEVVAEGIETADELRVLRDIGIAYGQGYYLAWPGTLEEVAALLAASRTPTRSRAARNDPGPKLARCPFARSVGDRGGTCQAI